eukprot:m.228080 g.228080  ORF g.228080 m.228080 type:complete len:351 (-) comp37455_c0_seq1:30-1082(-)
MEVHVAVDVDQDGRLIAPGYTDLNYTTRALHNTMANVDAHTMDSVLRDCEAVFCSESFWIGASERPRCTLEDMAMQIFNHHVSEAGPAVDRATSGAEWWVQVRRPDDDLGGSVGFHWDKDEDAVDSDGLNIFPHLSTVTYLAGDATMAAPTVVVDAVAGPHYGGPLTSEVTRTFISRPEVGKHLAFDGRFLHGAPADLVADETTAVDSSTVHAAGHIRGSHSGPRLKAQRTAGNQPRRRGPHDAVLSAAPAPSSVRVTFLVNVWLSYQPSTVDLTDEALAGLSKAPIQLHFTHPTLPARVPVRNPQHVFTTRFGGQGGTDETLCIPIPGTLPTDSSILLLHRRGALGHIL